MLRDPCVRSDFCRRLLFVQNERKGIQAGASATVPIDRQAVITGWLAPSTRARRGSVFDPMGSHAHRGMVSPGVSPAAKAASNGLRPTKKEIIMFKTALVLAAIVGAIQFGAGVAGGSNATDAVASAAQSRAAQIEAALN